MLRSHWMLRKPAPSPPMRSPPPRKPPPPPPYLCVCVGGVMDGAWVDGPWLGRRNNDDASSRVRSIGVYAPAAAAAIAAAPAVAAAAAPVVIAPAGSVAVCAWCGAQGGRWMGGWMSVMRRIVIGGK